MTTGSLVFRQTEDGTLVAPPTCGLLTVPDFLAQVQRCASDGGPVVVDLSEVVDLDTSAFRSLVWARRHCTNRGVRFAVVQPPPGVLRVQEQMILIDLLPVYEDRESAWKGSAPGPAAHGLPAQRAHQVRRVRYRPTFDPPPP